MFSFRLFFLPYIVGVKNNAKPMTSFYLFFLPIHIGLSKRTMTNTPNGVIEDDNTRVVQPE